MILNLIYNAIETHKRKMDIHKPHVDIAMCVLNARGPSCVHRWLRQNESNSAKQENTVSGGIMAMSETRTSRQEISNMRYPHP